MLASIIALVVGLLLSIPAAAQPVIYFMPQPDWLGFTPYIAETCNGTDETIKIPGGVVYREAMKQGIRPASRATIVRAMRESKHASTARKMLLALEIAGWVATVAMASDSLYISERARALIPLAATGIRFGTTITKREASDMEMPGVQVPTVISLPAGACTMEYVIFGVNTGGRN